MLVDLLRSLWTKFQTWAIDGWNWLHQFISKIFDWISSWFNALYDFISELLEEDGEECAIINTNTTIGSEIYAKIVEQCPKTTSINKYDRNGKVVAAFDKYHNIKKVENFNANHVQDANTDFDRDLARDGIIRMTA